jgi:hypothetical protein
MAVYKGILRLNHPYDDIHNDSSVRTTLKGLLALRITWPSV